MQTVSQNPRTDPPAERARARVLIVDDESCVRELLHDVLAGVCDCDLASNATEALGLAAEREYDVVLCDVMMPEVSGMEVLKHFRNHGKTTSVIMVTAVQDTRRAVAAMRLGAFDYVLKPFDIDEVELGVLRGAEQKWMLDENRSYHAQLESLVVERTSQLQEVNGQLEAALVELSLSYRATLATLTAVLETRNVEDEGHTERVTAYALRLAREIGVSAEGLEALESGALLHDVGMICIPESIVRKQGSLGDDEFAEIMRHTEYGGMLLRRIGFLTAAISVVEQHHERWDGTGYPAGLRGEEISLEARIFAVADCIDAMTSARPYGTPRRMRDVAEELTRCAGTQFDPSVVEHFHRIPLDEWEQLVSRPAQPGLPATRVTGPLSLPKGVYL